MASMPRLKTTFAQGTLIAELLRTVGSKQINSSGYVYQQMCDYIPHELRSRQARSGEALTDLQLRKHIDQEHSRAKAYCQAFDLISEQRDQVMLTFFGHKVVSRMQDLEINDIFDPGCSGLLARIYLHVDGRRWGMMNTVGNLGTPVTAIEITEQLLQRGVDMGLSTGRKSQIRRNLWKELKSKLYWQDLQVEVDRRLKVIESERGVSSVQQLLVFFVRAGVVNKVGEHYQINQQHVEELEQTRYWNEDPIKRSLFLSKLESAYRLRSGELNLTDVPLPHLRDTVCQDLDITWNRFDEILKKLPRTIGEYILAFSPSRFPEKWGIDLGGRNVYYLALIHGGE